jgi:hypothetical protein
MHGEDCRFFILWLYCCRCHNSFQLELGSEASVSFLMLCSIVIAIEH